MLIKLTLAASLLMTSADLPQSFKDGPTHVIQRHRTKQSSDPPQRRRVAVPVPERNEDRPVPYVYIQGGGDLRLPLSEAEMERYGYEIGQTIPLSEAARIVEEKSR